MKKVVFIFSVLTLFACNKVKEEVENKINAHVDSLESKAIEIVDSTSNDLKTKVDSLSKVTKEKATQKTDSITNDMKEKAKEKAKEAVNKKIDEVFN